jgi:hypothetical protein
MLEKKLLGPDSTPDVKTESVCALRCASGKDRPTHFSRTQRGASPGGTDVMRRCEAGLLGPSVWASFRYEALGISASE